MLGLWAAVTWEGLGRPDPVLLAEAGPGRGTLLRDALRAIGQAAPAFRSALRLHLVETSPRLREIQAAALPQATWHDEIAALPPGPLILLANEFLDALPIRQFVRRGEGWAERFVRDGAWLEMQSPSPPNLPRELRGRGGTIPEGTILEIREPAVAIADALARRFAAQPGVAQPGVAQPGAALFLDYGPAESTFGDSLQAIRDGAFADPLAEPGRADLTAHVDFAAFAAAARAAGAAAHGPLPQGVFLTRLGLMQRTDRLARTQPPRRALALIDAARRLVEPDRMGRLFKALALTPPAAPAPAGFEAT